MDAYIFQGDIYCEDCADDIKAQRANRRHCEDSDDYPQGPYADGGGEADCPNHCGNCGEFLENPLTDEGRRYVLYAVAGRRGTRRMARLLHNHPMT